MNRKQLTLLVVVGLLLGGLAWYASSTRQQEYEKRDAGVGEKLLGDFPADNVAQLTVKSRDGEVNLLKQDTWVVKERSGYPASFGSISELVRKLWDLKPVQSQKVGQSQWGRLELLAPDAKDAGTNTATLVDLKDKDGKTIRSVLLGKKQMRDSGGQFGGYPVGRWLAVPDNKETVFLVGEAFAEVETKPENWVEKEFFKVEKIQAISLVSTNATNSWSLSRTNETADWVMAEPRAGEELDKSKTSGFNWALSSPSFNDVYPKDAPEVKDAFTHPTTVQLRTFEGFAYTLGVGSQPDSDSFYVTVAATADLPKERAAPADEKAEDKEKNQKAWQEAQDKLKAKLKKEQGLEKWVFKVAKWTVDSVLKDRSGLMTEKKSETPDASGPGSVKLDASETDLDVTPPPLPNVNAGVVPPLAVPTPTPPAPVTIKAPPLPVAVPTPAPTQPAPGADAKPAPAVTNAPPAPPAAPKP